MNFKKYLSNLPGWRTKRKIVVIESDDWGSIRMPSLRVYEKLKTKGLNIDFGDNRRYNTLDTLASSEDFEVLFNTLKSFKDINGRHPVITAMSLSANPDFEKIEAEKFSKYYYLPLPETLKSYQIENALNYWKKGESEKLFIPEFHGREHLDVKLWMKALQNGDESTVTAFKYKFWGFRPKSLNGMAYQAAFNLHDLSHIPFQKEIIQSGVKLFNNLHQRKPSYFVPPNGLIYKDIIDEAVNAGITYISRSKIQKEPQGNGKFKKRFHYIGKKGKNGLIYLTRNCFFEPSSKDNGFSFEDCLKDIEIAFNFNKPAVISTHRVNYIGGLKPKNRDEGNIALAKLLSKMLIQWPDIEFMSSVELGDTIRTENKLGMF